MRRKLIWAATAGVLGLQVGMAGEARAAFISSSQSFFIQDSISGEAAGSYTSRLSGLAFVELPRFDPTFGTLTGVQLSFTSEVRLLVAGSAIDQFGESDFFPLPPFLFNPRNDTRLSALLNTNLTLNMFDPGFGSRSDAPLLSDSCADSNTNVLNSDASCSFGENAITQFDGSFAASAADFASFQGADPLNFFAQATGVLSGVCDFDDRGDLCRVASDLLWRGIVAVRYDYDLPGENGGGGSGGGGGGDGGSVPVPEPGTLPLLSAALLACLLRRRRTA